ALDLAWARLERARLERHLAANSPDEAGRPRLDDALHRYWIDLAGNRYIGEFFHRYGAYFQAVFRRAAQDVAVRSQASAEHRQILQAALEGDRERAYRALAEHIRGQRKKVADAFQGFPGG
ncbi:MAG: FCD domain-containing protein, partial [Gemmataceae bacterium]